MKLDTNDPRFSEFQNIKRKFFALRNGIVADALRQGGDPHRLIFGLTVVQLRQIAQVTEASTALADMLWANDTTRESRLLAPLVYPKDCLPQARAAEMLSQVLSAEEADMLCHGALRHYPYALDIALQALERTDATPVQVYAALRLLFNIVSHHPQSILPVAQKFTGHPSAGVAALAASLAQEAGFFLE